MNWPRYIVEYGQAAATIGNAAERGRRYPAAAQVLSQTPGLGSRHPAMVLIYKAGGFLLWARTKVDPLKPVFSGATKSAPDLAFVAADGSAHRISEYRGKVVVLNLWATWVRRVSR